MEGQKQTQTSEYLREKFYQPLTKSLHKIAKTRPVDPVAALISDLQGKPAMTASEYEKDLTSHFINRPWRVSTKKAIAGKKTPHALKFLHWNILAQRLCDAFDLIDDAAPMLVFDNRLRLMKEHIVNVDADIVAMSEIDTLGGKNADCLQKLVQMMKDLGYCCQVYDKSNNMSGSGIWYKEDKYILCETKQLIFAPGGSQFLMNVIFQSKENEKFKFAVGECHLKAKPENMEERVQQTQMICDFYADKEFENIPVLVAGDFNEEP